MLMFGGEAKPAALGNFYYSPLRLRPVLEPRFHSDAPSSPARRRQKKESTLDLEMDLRPSDPRQSVRKAEKSADEESPLAKVDRDTAEESDGEEEEEEEEKPKPKPKKKKKRRKSKHRNKDKDKERGNEALEKLCRKLRISYVLAFLGVLVLLVCGCALYLRNRLIACCQRCWPFKKWSKKSKKNMFDVEGGDSPILSRRPFKSKKKGAETKTVDTGVPDSRTSLTKSPAETGKVGCSPCCRKKKKKKDKKRRK